EEDGGVVEHLDPLPSPVVGLLGAKELREDADVGPVEDDALLELLGVEDRLILLVLALTNGLLLDGGDGHGLRPGVLDVRGSNVLGKEFPDLHSVSPLVGRASTIRQSARPLCRTLTTNLSTGAPSGSRTTWARPYMSSGSAASGRTSSTSGAS